MTSFFPLYIYITLHKLLRHTSVTSTNQYVDEVTCIIMMYYQSFINLLSIIFFKIAQEKINVRKKIGIQ